MGDLPTLPLFVDDYEAATAHLTLEEDGAYMRLLRLLWRQPDCSIPADDKWIMRMLRCDEEVFRRSVAPILSEFFTKSRSRYFQKRLREEHAYVRAKISARREAGQRGGKVKAMKTKEKRSSKTKDLPEQNSSKPVAPNPTHFLPSEASIGGGGGCAPTHAHAREWPTPDLTFRERLLAAMGADPVSGLTGPNGRVIGTQADMVEAGKWISDLGLTEAQCLAEVSALVAAKRDGPPKGFRYFRSAMQRLAAAHSAPPLTPMEFEDGPRSPETAAPGSPNPRAGRGKDQLYEGFARAAARYED